MKLSILRSPQDTAVSTTPYVDIADPPYALNSISEFETKFICEFVTVFLLSILKRARISSKNKTGLGSITHSTYLDTPIFLLVTTSTFTSRPTYSIAPLLPLARLRDALGLRTSFPFFTTRN